MLVLFVRDWIAWITRLSEYSARPEENVSVISMRLHQVEDGLLQSSPSPVEELHLLIVPVVYVIVRQMWRCPSSPLLYLAEQDGIAGVQI